MEFTKIVNPVKCEVYGRKSLVNAYAKITYHDGALSIHGVVGPLSNGNCNGGAGQCQDEIRGGVPTNDWTPEMVQKFCDIWDAWHLNDMRPYCAHQKELGWDKIAGERVTMYHYKMNMEAVNKRNEAKRAAETALMNGETFTPTAEQTKYAAMRYAIASWKELTGDALNDYEPKKPLFAGDTGFTETKLLGWMRPDEHPDGLLGRECPVCGYQYGHAWKKEEVPADVLEWLAALPDTKTQPAWV